MNYFLHNWFVLIFALCFLTALGLAYVLLSFIQNPLEKIKLPQFIKGIMPFVGYLAAIFLWLACSWLVYYQLSDDKVKELYIFNSNSNPRLTVWLTPRLKTFDLESGKFIGRFDLVKWRNPKNYKIFGPFGNKAWGYSRKNGLALLDMAQPKCLANEKAILKKNPQLGNKFRLIYGDYIYDPVNNAIQVIGQDGSYFRINKDLTATRLNKFAYHYVPKPKYWTFDAASDSAGKTLRRQGAPRSNSKKTVLLGPEIVKELDKKAAARNRKVWVKHYSTLFGDYDLFISYLDANGRELARINLSKLFKDKHTKPVATLTRKNEILVFVTKGGYTLTALRTDPVTGKIRSKTEYIK